MEFEKELNLTREFPPPSYADWKKAVEESLKGADFDKVMHTKTYEGITLKPIYRREDLEALGFLSNLPGQAPYLRGSDPRRFLSEGWLIAQNHAESDPKGLNAVLLKELQAGLNAVNITLFNQDSGNGVAIDSLGTLRAVLNSIDLKAAPLFMQLDIKQGGMLKLIGEYAAETGLNLAELELGVGFDPTGEFARKGYLEFPLEEIWQKMLAYVRWALDKAPAARVISIDATVYENAGASAVQELAFALSTAIGYLQGLGQSGMDAGELAKLFQVKLSLGSNFFMGIAKIRAFRLLWAEMIKAFGGGGNAQKIWIHGRTARFNKSLYDVYVNLLRTSTEAFAGVIGGVDSLEVDCFDALINEPDEFSRRIARNQQLILKEEAHFDKVADPAGGCYYIESLTGELANKAWALMQEIEGLGGMVRALRNGHIHEMTARVADSRIDAVHRRKDVFVGVNMFANPDEQLDVRIQVPVADVAQKAVTLDCGPLPRIRAVGKLEQLRTAVSRSAANTKIMLLNMGSLAEYKARADFAQGFFQPGGFEVVYPDGFASPQEAAAAAKASGAGAICICSTDDNYRTLVPQLCELLPKRTLILAGYPADMVETYRQNGIDAFIHIRADLYATLRELAVRMGVIA